MTTEFWAMGGVIAAILIAAQQLDHFSGQERGRWLPPSLSATCLAGAWPSQVVATAIQISSPQARSGKTSN